MPKPKGSNYWCCGGAYLQRCKTLCLTPLGQIRRRQNKGKVTTNSCLFQKSIKDGCAYRYLTFLTRGGIMISKAGQVLQYWTGFHVHIGWILTLYCSLQSLTVIKPLLCTYKEWKWIFDYSNVLTQKTLNLEPIWILKFHFESET